MSALQPCEKYLDIWRVGEEWLKVPEGAVCPRCGYFREEHAPVIGTEDHSAQRSERLASERSAQDHTLKWTP